MRRCIFTVWAFSRNLYDVAVVGSGPAGSSAALCLARQGVRVVIVEKASLPRYKTCGGGIVHRVIQLLPLDIRAAIERECYRAELHLLDAALHFSTSRPEPIIAMTMRAQLDFLLVSAAKDAGAEVQSACEVLDVVRQADRVELVTNKGALFARFVVAADGVRSVVARKAGWTETRHLIPALECEVSVSNEILQRFHHAARFDFGVVPYGYAWVFPKKEHLSMGVLSMRRGPINLHGLFAQYMERMGIDKSSGQERHGFLIPVSPRKGTLVKSRVLLIGDGAGFADPVTGEGITFAIQSGQIAARALLEGDFAEDRVRQAYEVEVAQSILPELRWGRVLARLIYDYPRVRTWLFRMWGQPLSEAVTNVLMGKGTYRSTIYNFLNSHICAFPKR